MKSDEVISEYGRKYRRELSPRVRYVMEKAEGKDVLEIGPGSDFSYGKEIDVEDSMAYLVRRVAKSYTAIELSAEATEKLRKCGFNVFCGNAETTDCKSKFDLIVAGDVIEHLDNLGLFLDNMRGQMRENCELVISSGNPYALNHLFRLLFFLKLNVFFEHTCFVAKENLQELAGRHALGVADFKYYTMIDRRSKALELKSYLVLLAGKIWPEMNLGWIAALKKKNGKNEPAR